MIDEVVIEERMLELNGEGTPQEDILEACADEFGTQQANAVFDKLFTLQDRIAQRLGIEV